MEKKLEVATTIGLILVIILQIIGMYNISRKFDLLHENMNRQFDLLHENMNNNFDKLEKL